MSTALPPRSPIEPERMIELAQKLNPGIDFQQGNMAALDVEDGFGQASWPSTPSPAPAAGPGPARVLSSALDE